MDPLNGKQITPTEPDLVEDEMAAANRSLSDALRISFLLLSIGMVAAVPLFLISGFTFVKTGQVGVELRFGRILGEGDARIVRPGLSFSWPKPIGEIVTIPTALQNIHIDDFWMGERPEDANKPLNQRTPTGEGLRAGWDGALLTGDRGLVHVKLSCRYAVGAGEDKDAHEPEHILNYLDHVGNLANAKRVVHAAIVNAAIRTAATMTVELFRSTGQEDFAKNVKKLAQERLDAMKAGIHIRMVQRGTTTVPLAVIPDFDNVSRARQEQSTMINAARAYANDVRQQAAGGVWRELTGPAELAATPLPAAEQRKAFVAYVAAVKAKDADAVEKHRTTIRSFGLLKLYADAREQKEEAFAEQVLAEINHVLESNRAGGMAATIINQAKGYRGSIESNVAAAVRDFESYAEKYEENPELLIQSLWIDTKLEIFARKDVEKVIIPPGQRTVIKVSRDPDIARKTKARQLEAGITPPNTGANQWSPPKPPNP